MKAELTFDVSYDWLEGDNYNLNSRLAGIRAPSLEAATAYFNDHVRQRLDEDTPLAGATVWMKFTGVVLGRGVHLFTHQIQTPCTPQQ